MSDKVGFGANKLIISVPPCETPATVDWAINLATQYWPLGICREFTSQEGLGDDLDLLRNHTAGYALATKARYIWFLSERCLPPNWAVHRLLEAMRTDPKIMICAGVSRTNTPDSIDYNEEVALFKDEQGNEFEVLSLKRNNSVGLECTIVRAELFDVLPEPWFKSNDLVKSDALLSYKAIEEGFKVCVHSGVMCGHVDESGRAIWPSEVLVA